MNRERLAVANKIATQLDSVSKVNETLRIISEARPENISITFSIYCNSEKGEVSVSAGELLGYDFTLDNIISNVVSELKQNISSVYEDLNTKFENDQFDEEKK